MKIDGRHRGVIGDGHTRRMAAGDHEAFHEIFEAWRSRVLYYAWQLAGGDKALCEDIVQEAFVLLWSRRGQLDTVLAAKTFLYTTVKNKVWRHLRDTAARQRRLDALPAAEAELDPEDDMVNVAELCGQIRQAVATLSPQARRAVECALRGMSLEQTACEMNLSVNTVKTMRQRAYRQLRQQLEHLRGLLFLLF